MTSVQQAALSLTPFTGTGILDVGHAAHSATLLPDGTVLVAGGTIDPFSDFARPVNGSIVVYDPVLGGFSPRSDFSTPRALHTATLLEDGTVLFTGGEQNGLDSLASIERFYPGTGALVSTGSMAVPRQGHTATLLPGGQVLIVGGYVGSRQQITETAELYDPSTGRCFPTGSLTARRQLHTATLLPSGQVLIAGGYDERGGLAEAELYDPTSGQFSPTGALATPRFLHRATLLADGRVLMTGGAGPDSLASCELYDPATGEFTRTGDLLTPRQIHTATLLPSGRVLVTGGSPGFQSTQALASAELYDPIIGRFVPAGSLSIPRHRHSATLMPSGQVLLVGGHNDTNALVAELYTPPTVTVTLEPAGATLAAGGSQIFAATVNGTANSAVAWTTTGGAITAAGEFTAPSTPGTYFVIAISTAAPGAYAAVAVTVVSDTPSMVSVLGSHSVHTETLLGDGRVLLAGGTSLPFVDFARPVTAGAEIYDPAQGLLRTGDLLAARALHTATLLGSGAVLIAGGEQDGTLSLASAELYQPSLGRFVATGSMTVRRQGHAATRLGDGRVLIVGGYDGIARQLLGSAEIYDPARGVFQVTGSLRVPRQLHSANLLADGRVLITGGVSPSGAIASAEIYNPSTGQFSAAGNLTTGRFLHRATRMSDGRVLVTGGSGALYRGANSLGSCEIYNPQTGAFTPTGNLNSPRQAHTATLLSDGRVVVTGGAVNFEGATTLASVESYDPASGTFTLQTAMGAARQRHSATLLVSGRLLISGGHDATANVTTAESYAVPAPPPPPPPPPPTSSPYFPAGTEWDRDVSTASRDAESAQVISTLAALGGWGTGIVRIDFSLEVLQADASAPFLSFTPTSNFYSPDCDQVPVPIPLGGALEGEAGYQCTTGGDCHLLVVHQPTRKLYEMFAASIVSGTFYGGCLAVWDLTRRYGPSGRGEQCTSADAAGFPIAPLLFNADEVAAGAINHALRFTLPNSRIRAGTYVHPANHAGGPSGPATAPPYGARFRLRADYPIASLPSIGARVVARALQKYGMLLSDGGSITLTAQSDRFTTHKWSGLIDVTDLAQLQVTDFEMIDAGSRIPLTYDCVRTP